MKTALNPVKFCADGNSMRGEDVVDLSNPVSRPQTSHILHKQIAGRSGTYNWKTSDVSDV